MNFKFLRNLISASHATLALVLVALDLDSLTQLSMAVQLATRKDENFTKSVPISQSYIVILNILTLLYNPLRH